ncbi:hypothetical protein KFU94_48580 [Chloroflexi bacterium TSY]|nr:hypothetical protein [Chloroflexi bacterium TSY]
MTVAERHTAIEQPAINAGRRFEEGLVERILEAVAHELGQLPLLQFALTELWERQTADGLLTHKAYEEIGQVNGAIAQRAEEALLSFESDEQTAVRAIFTRLVRVAQPNEEVEDVKRRISLAELNTHLQPLLHKLADARLIVMGRNERTNEETVEVSHEALLRNWQELQMWLNSDREFLLWRQRLRTLAENWISLQKDESVLLRGVLLTEAEGWADRSNELSAIERELITSSRILADRETAEKEAIRQRELQQAQELAEEQKLRAEAEQQRADAESQRAITEATTSARLRRQRLLLLILALLAAGIAIYAFFQQSIADDQRRRAERSEDRALDEKATAVAAKSTAEYNEQLAEENEYWARNAEQNALDNQYFARIARETAVAQANEAAIAKSTAEANRLEAVSNKLSAQALAERNTRPKVSLLLVLEAIDLADDTFDQSDDIYAREALQRILIAASSVSTSTLPNRIRPIQKIKYTREGVKLALQKEQK